MLATHFGLKLAPVWAGVWDWMWECAWAGVRAVWADMRICLPRCCGPAKGAGVRALEHVEKDALVAFIGGHVAGAAYR